MQQHSWSVVSLWIVLVLAGGLVLGACGDDDQPAAIDSATNDESSSGGSNGDEIEIAGSADDSDLLVPRDYVQGEWCDSDGQTWTIDGDTVRLEDDASGGVIEVPVDIAFIDGPEETLVSQTDDQFVIMFAGDEITFSRGSC